MIKEMIKALEGARAKLVENESEINNIIRKLEDTMDKIDDITCFASEAIIPNNCYLELYFQVMMEDEDYGNFNCRTTDEIKDNLKNISKKTGEDYDSYRNVVTIYQRYFDWYNTKTKTKEKARFRDGYLRSCIYQDFDVNLNTMLDTLKENIDMLKELC